MEKKEFKYEDIKEEYLKTINEIAQITGRSPEEIDAFISQNMKKFFDSEDLDDLNLTKEDI